MKYAPRSVCINGDLVPIAGKKHQEDLTARLQDALAEANKRFGEQADLPLELHAGNEWRGLVRTLSAAFQVDFFLRQRLFPIRIATGIGAGEVSDGYIDDRNTIGGPAVIRARQGIERARRHRGGVFLATGIVPLDTGANTISMLLQTIFETWTRKQLEAYLAYRKHGTEALAAEKVGITQSALHQRLAAARAKTYELAGEQLLWFVDHFPAVEEDVDAGKGGKKGLIFPLS
ncbi:SatD family protein [Geoalkalibacter subterraneus]|uniref:SatD n=1 Tax=Geoalkalibacter subterraneus TaxID=483547 RepID=A0A0B5FIC2_9BACT|nr:SatD family protein [Geoalkalibacter subterraneus]AJF07083.1 hypothetical protein GSUB_11645 [Geoalkalibacter subterraneus]